MATVRVRVLGGFCAEPNLDVAKGALLDVEPWVARYWAAVGHVEIAADDVADVLGPYVVDRVDEGISVFSG